MKKSLIKISDLKKEEVEKILKRAFYYKKQDDLGVRKEDILRGKNAVLVFEKPSLRTKVSFESAINYLGGNTVFLSGEQIFAIGNETQGRESIYDITKNLERFCDIILARVFSNESITQIDNFSTKPVINLLCNQHHPTQALADIMVIKWHKKTLDNLKISFIGDANNVARSLLEICVLLEINFSIASPSGYSFSEKEQKLMQEKVKNKKVKIEFSNDPQSTVKNADIVYTDTFLSMGEEGMKDKLKKFKGFQVNLDLLKQAKKEALFMHCLPAHRGLEVTDEVIDSKQSIVFDQAECRMHVAKALISLLI